MKPVPEAQLQAYVLAILRDQLPHLKPDDFRVETRFKITLGHTERDWDGAADWTAEGRADLLIFHRDRPLAVLELKREDKSLSEATVIQGRSYANQMLDRPPLVIVSNGKETWIRQTIDGAPLDHSIEGADFVETLFANVGKVAAANLSWAIETLMGPDLSVWVEAVRERTDETIGRMTGSTHDTRRPFGRGRLFARAATATIADLLGSGVPAIIVEGPPLAGKSNVLRELACQMRQSPDWAILMVNGATAGPGLFQRIANLFGAALEWQLSADDVRAWLRRMSHSSRTPALVLAIDGVKPGSAIASDIEELAEAGFGSGLRLIVCADRADDLCRDHSGRGETALAAIAQFVEVGTLTDVEFQRIREQLADEQIFFFGGAEICAEYRAPWILRSILPDDTAISDPDRAMVIPASMGLKFMKDAGRRLADLTEAARLHRAVARDALNDELPESPAFALARASAYVVHRDALSSAGEAAATQLESQGWISFYRDRSGDDVLVFRVPEFFMCELASALANAVGALIDNDPAGAAALLLAHCDRLFLGDLIGAQAIVDLVRQRKKVSNEFIAFLMNDRPEAERLANTLIAFAGEEGEVTHFRVDGSGAIALADSEGKLLGPFHMPDAVDGPGTLYGNMISWLILSHLARLRIAFTADIKQRFDVEIILHVGRAKMPLISGGTVQAPKALAMRTMGSAGTILNPSHGLAEPLTAAIHKLFAEEWRDVEFLFDEVAQAGSLALSARVHNALLPLCNAANPDLAAWASEKLKVMRPLLQSQIPAPDA